MAVADVAELEWKKLWKHLKEMEIVGPYLISGQSREIRRLLEDHRRLVAGAPKEYLKLLRKLNNEMGEYRVFAHQVMDKKKNIFRFNPVTKTLFLRERRKSLGKIREEMSRIEALVESERRSRSSVPVTESRLPLQADSVDDDDVVGGIIGFDDMAKEIENAVLGVGEGDDLIGYGITGMSGVGKTSLALKVFHGTKISREFPIRIWVSLCDVDMRGDGFNSQVVQIEIVTYMLNKLNYHEVSEEELRGGGTIHQLLTKLKKQLSKQKYLIVLDGAWQEHPWYLNLHKECSYDGHNSLSYGLHKGGCGGAVIVTSRQEQLVKRMVGDHSFTTRLDHHSALLQDVSCKMFENALQIGEIFKIHQINETTTQDRIEEVLLSVQDSEYSETIISKGNSTTAQKVFNSDRICQKFPSCRLWVSLSDLHLNRRSDLDETINRILQKLRCNIEEEEERKGGVMRESNPRLIVLDGVRILPDDLFAFLRRLFHFLHIISNKAAGLAILATAKWLEVAINHLDPDYYECKYLMTEHLLRSCLEKIKDDIKYKIQGLPLAAMELAPLIPQQILKLACKKANEGKSGVWPALELCVVITYRSL